MKYAACGLLVAVSLLGQTHAYVSTSQNTAPPIQASSADSFIASIGVNTHYSLPGLYNSNWILDTMIIQSGIRHIRQGPMANSVDGVYLAANGITQTLFIDPWHGLIPNSLYWSGAIPGNTHTLTDYLTSRTPSGFVTRIEGPNELDIFWANYSWANAGQPLSNSPVSPFYYAAYGQAVTQDSYGIVQASFPGIKTIGPTVGLLTPSVYTTNAFYNFVDYGGFHTYPNRANPIANPVVPYDTITQYYFHSFEPSVNMGVDTYGGNPAMFTWYQPPFLDGLGNQRAMASTETGYYTGTGNGAVSVTAQAKYIPRLFAEYFRNGVVETDSYEFLDEGTDPTFSENNYGLIFNNLQPKPSFTALSSLMALLRDSGSFTPGSLNYSLAVTANGAYTRTGYVHDLLLQKSNGDYYLLLWHEISNSSDTDVSGNPISGQQRDIVPLALTTVVTLPAGVVSAQVYTYDAKWKLVPQVLTITASQVSVQATDTIIVLRLSTQPLPTGSVYSGSFSGNFSLN